MELPCFGTWMVPVSCRDFSALFVPARDMELSQQGDSTSLDTHILKEILC